MGEYKHDWAAISKAAIETRKSNIENLTNKVKGLYEHYPVLKKCFNEENLSADIEEFLELPIDEYCSPDNIFMLLNEDFSCELTEPDCDIDLSEEELDLLFDISKELSSSLNQCLKPTLPKDFFCYLFEDSIVALHNIFNNEDNLKFDDYTLLVNQRLSSNEFGLCKYDFDKSTFEFEPLGKDVIGDYVSIEFGLTFREKDGSAEAYIISITYYNGCDENGWYNFSGDDEDKINSDIEDFKTKIFDCIINERHSPWGLYLENERKKALGLSKDFTKIAWLNKDSLIDYSEKSYKLGKMYIPKSVVAIINDNVYMKYWFYNKECNQLRENAKS